MDYRRGAPPLNDRVRSQDAQAAQQSQVTRNHQAGYNHEMDVGSISNQDGVNSANSGANNHSQVENQSQGQHVHTHPFVHRPRGQYSQRRTHNVQSRSGPGNSRKRAYEPDYSYADVFLSADQREQRMGVRRLPFVGEFLQQEPHDKVNVQYNGPQYKDQLELMGGDQSSINWFAPDRQSKSIYGHQFVAKVATDDESLMALVKTIQLEARRQGSPIVNLWMQCQDPNEQRKLSKTPPVVGHTYNDLAVSYNTSIQRCTACGKAGHRVRHCPQPDPVHFSISMCPVCDTQDHPFDACFEVRKRLPLIDRSHEPDVIEDYKWFGEMLITRRVNKPPVRTTQVSWTTVALYLHHHAPDFKFQGAPWSLPFTCKMATAHRRDEILNGRTHWQDWDPSKGHRDEDLPTDPLCRSMEVIVESLRRRELTSEQFMSAGQCKPDEAAVDEPQSRDRSMPVIIKKEDEPATLKTEAQPVTFKTEAVTLKTEPQPVRIKMEAEPVRVKAEPDTEGSGITVPKEPVKLPIEHVTVTERCLQILDDDDDEVDLADYIYRSMPPTKPHNAVIQPAQMRPQALQAAALRVARNNSLRQYGESSTANDLDPDTQMTEGDPPAGVSQSGQASKDAGNAADDSPVEEDEENVQHLDGENDVFFPSQMPKRKPSGIQGDLSDEDEEPKYLVDFLPARY